MGFVHRRGAALVDDVPVAIEHREHGARGGVLFRLGHAFWQRRDDEPAHLHIAGTRAKHRPGRPQIGVITRIEPARAAVLPNFEQATKIGIPGKHRGPAIEDDDRLASRIVAGDDTAHGILKCRHQMRSLT